MKLLVGDGEEYKRLILLLLEIQAYISREAFWIRVSDRIEKNQVVNNLYTCISVFSKLNSGEFFNRCPI